MSNKILIANRGEVACRIINAAKLLGIPSVAVYSDADESAPHVRMADESVAIGPAPAVKSYLRQDAIIEVAKATGATLIHPGYGFLAENAGFARMCLDANLVFIGPSPEVIAAMGDKGEARRLAIEAGVPVSPGTEKLDICSNEIIAEAQRVGYPLLVKATAGGGGIGMSLVETPDNLLKAVETTRSLAERAFGDDAIYLEHFVKQARHIEVQVFGFGNGRAVHLFDRDCSVQRRHQKVIEEAVSPALSTNKRKEIAEVAVRLAEACSYEGAGTVEFLYDDDNGEFFFLEMNTRIQVEHPVTEMVTGVDLVVAQIRQAMGEDLTQVMAQDRIQLCGHAIEARIYAERPNKNFLPSPGPLNVLVIPQGEGVRVDTGFCQGMKVTPYYDPMLMKIIAYGVNRNEAIKRLDNALSELVIEGVECNRDFLRKTLSHPDFVAGRCYTTWLNDVINELVQC